MPTNSQITTEKRGPSYFEQYGKAISVVGIVIVFATFIIRDGFRENVKDLRDSIESAETLNLLRTDSQQTQRRVELANDNILDFESQFRAITEHEVDPYKTHGANSSDMGTLVAFAMTQFDTARSTLQTTKDLSSEFPISDQEEKDLVNESQDLDRLRTQLESMDKTLAALSNQKGGGTTSQSTAPNSSEEFESVVRTSSDVLPNLQRVTNQVAQTSAKVLQSAKDYREKLTRWYVRYTWASWGLYTFGTILTLFGRLFGADVDAIP